MPAFPPAFAAWGWYEELETNPTFNGTHSRWVAVVDLGATMDSNFWSNVDQDGDDIRVTQIDGVTELDFKIVTIDVLGQEGQLYIALPTTASQTEWVRIYYDNPAAANASSTDTFDEYELFHCYEGNANDETANGNNGTLTGGAAVGGTGIIGERVNLPGNSSNEVAVNHDAGLNPNGSDFTVGLWFKWLTTFSGYTAAITKGVYVSSGGEWSLNFRTGTPYNGAYVRFRDTGGNTDVNLSSNQESTIGDGSWHLLGFSHDHGASPSTRIYLDGVEVGSGTITRVINSSLGLRIGNYQGVGGQNRDFDNVFIQKGFARSLAWWQDTYANQSDPAGFWVADPPVPNETCELTITNATPTACSGGVGSTFDLSVTVEYQFPPASGTLDFIIDGTTYSRTIGTSPQVEVITGLPCGDGDTSPVTAQFSAETSCNDSDTFTVPNPNPCTISIGTISQPVCGGSTYDVTIPLTYTNAPVGGQIRITLNGVDAYLFSVAGSPQNVVVTGRSCGEGTVNVLAEFVEDASCSDTDSYSAPLPLCNIDIDSLTPSLCVGGTYSLSVQVSYQNEPGSGFLNVVVDGNGTLENITTSPQTIVISPLVCNGQQKTVDVSFTANPGCADSDTYTAPDDASPFEQIRVLVDGTDYTDGVGNLNQFEISLNLVDYEYFYEYPRKLAVYGALHDYLRGLDICAKPSLELEYKCFGATTWQPLAKLQIDLISSQWETCTCTGDMALEDISESNKLRQSRGDTVSIAPDTSLSNLTEYDTGCILQRDGADLPVKGMRFFDLMQNVIDANLGAGKVTLISNFLTQDYQPEIQQLTVTGLDTTAGNLQLRDVNTYSGAEIYATKPRSGLQSTRDAVIAELKALEQAYGVQLEDPGPDEATGAVFFDYAPDRDDNEALLTFVNWLPKTMRFFVGATQINGTITQNFQQGAGNLFVCQGLSGDPIKTSWGELTDFVKRAYGCGILYKEDEIHIEPMADFYMSTVGQPPLTGPTAKAPVTISGDHYTQEVPNSEWMKTRVLLGQPPAIERDDEKISNDNWQGCVPPDISPLRLSSETVRYVYTIAKHAAMNLGGDIGVRNQNTTGGPQTTDVVIYVDGIAVHTLATGLSVPDNTTVPVSLSGVIIDVGTGNTLEVRTENESDPAAFVDDTTVSSASYDDPACPNRPLVSETEIRSYRERGYDVHKEFDSCWGEAVDFRVPDSFYIGTGRMVSEAAQNGNSPPGKFLFHVLGSTIQQYPFKAFSHLDSVGYLPDGCNDMQGISQDVRMYCTPLSYHHIFFYVSNAHRLHLERLYARNQKLWNPSNNNITHNVTSQISSSDTYPNRVALGGYRHKIFTFETELETTEFLQLADTLRATATLCGVSETGEIKRITYNVLHKTAEIELLA